MEPLTYIWVHTCPARANQLDPLLESLAASDVQHFETACHPDGLSWDQIVGWWRDTWLAAARVASGAGLPYVVRIEDDVVVATHFEHNVSSWPALGCSDFGVGSLFMYDREFNRMDSWEVEPVSGALRSRADMLPGGFGQIIPTELVEPIMSEHAAALASIVHRRILPVRGPAFDYALTHAAHRLGRRLYVHVPALVRASPVAEVSVILHGPTQPVFADRIWDRDWRRSDDCPRDVEAEHLFGYETRWTVLRDGANSRVVSVRCAPNPLEAQVANYQGRPLVVRPDQLYATEREARAALGSQ